MKINLVDVFNQYASTGWGMRGAEWVRCLYKEARMKYLNTAGWQKGKKWMFFNSCFFIFIFYLLLSYRYCAIKFLLSAAARGPGAATIWPIISMCCIWDPWTKQIGWVGEGAGVQISLNKKLPLLQYMYFLFMLQLSFDKRRIILNNQH